MYDGVPMSNSTHMAMHYVNVQFHDAVWKKKKQCVNECSKWKCNPNSDSVVHFGYVTNYEDLDIWI